MKKNFSSKRSKKSQILYSIKRPIKSFCAKVSNDSKLFNSLYEHARKIKRERRYAQFAKLPIDEKLVVFETFRGRKYADSPKAIYEYMLKNPDYSDYKFVWFFKDRVMDEYLFLEKNERTKLILWGSPEYYKAYATSKYWFTNSRVPAMIRIRDGQNYVQCWHGTPLKKLGMDTELDARVYEEDPKRYTYMLSPSAYCTEKFTSAFNLKALGKEDIIIEEGYPRNDELVNFGQDDVRRIKEKLGIDSAKKVILYAATWRDDQYEKGVGYVYEPPIDFKKMREELGDGYVVLYRTHYYISNKADFEGLDGFVRDVTDYPDVNDLYKISDILITDYSSVFFDFGILKRPEIFYMYDLEKYRDVVRGFYISLDELPGPIVETQDELFEKIRTVDEWSQEKEITDKYEAFTNKYTYLDDGHATERVVKRIIGNY